MLFGDSMLLSTDEERQAQYRKKAESHGHYFPLAQRVPLESCLTASELKRLHEGREIAPQRSSLSGVCVTDLEQNMPYVTPSPYVPPLVKHGKLLCFLGEGHEQPEKEVLFTAKELLAIQGEPCFSRGAEGAFRSFVWEALEQMDMHQADRQIAKVAGNSFHLDVMGSFMLYCLSCVSLTLVGDAKQSAQ